MQRMKISREGVVLIKSFEGFRPRAVRLDDGRWVVGYGHTLSAREGASVSEPDAELLLQYDLIPVAKAVNERISAPVNQHQFDALASFAFSVGVERFVASDVLSRVNAGAAGEAADALIHWPDPEPAQTALRRRAAERALFVADPQYPVTLADLLSAPLPPPPAPVAVEAVVGTTEPEPQPVAEAEPSDATTTSGAMLAEPAPTAAAASDVAVVVPDFASPLSAEAEPVAEATDRQPSSAPPAAPELADGEGPEPEAAAQFARPDAVVDVAPQPVIDPPAEAEPFTESVAEDTAHAGFVSVPVEDTEPVAEAEADGAFIGEPTEVARIDSPAVEAPAEFAADSETDQATEADETAAAVPAFADPVDETPVALAPAEIPVGSLVAEPVVDAPVEPPALADTPLSEPTFAFGSRYTAYSAPVVGALADTGLSLERPTVDAADQTAAPALSLQSAADAGELLVLTPPAEHEVLSLARPAWSPEQRATGAAEATPLFGDDAGFGEGGLGPVVRPEVIDEPAEPVNWGETGAYGLMAAFGLLSFGMAMAAFRKAAVEVNGGQSQMMGWALAVIGVTCVGVAAWNLYRRLGPEHR